MSKSIKDWLAEGEQIYGAALDEYQQIETQLIEMDQRLAMKREEVNVIADKLGKPPIEASRRLSAEIIERGAPGSQPNSQNSIARALTGRGFGRP